MIRKSIVTAFFLCAIYSVVAYMNLNTSLKPLNQRQGNLVKCQEYAFSDSEKANYVITGSSMAYRISQDFLPTDYYTLALGGHSSFLGLEMVNRSLSLPKVVFVEMNTIFRSTNTVFVDEIFERPSFDMKKHIVITRDKFQFVPFLVNKANQYLSKSDGTDNNAKIDEATLQKRLTLQKKNYGQLPNEKLLKKNFDRLHELVSDLQSKNVCVVFFEMPMHPELCDSPLFNVLRSKFKENFSPTEFQYIFAQNCDNYSTTDGVHLIASSAQKMGDYIVAQFDQNYCSKN